MPATLPPPADTAVIGITGLANLLGVSTVTARKWLRDNKNRLPKPLPTPGRRRWSREIVLSWLRNGGVK